MISQARPPEFDQMLVDFMPGLWRLSAAHRSKFEDREDLVSETVAHCLKNWEAFDSNRIGFYLWLKRKMRGVASNMARSNSKYLRSKDKTENPQLQTESSASQEFSADLKSAGERLTGRGGEILTRFALGETLSELAEVYGVSKQRISQIVAKQRAILNAA